jgi:hypothetical protein
LGAGIASIGAAGAAALAAAGVAFAGIGAAQGTMQNERVARGDITREQALVETGSQGAGNIALYSSPAAAKETLKIFGDIAAFLNPFDGNGTATPYVDPMSQKYSSPEFNVYVGGSAVAGAVVPILAREYSVNPKGGR